MVLDIPRLHSLIPDVVKPRPTEVQVAQGHGVIEYGTETQSRCLLPGMACSRATRARVPLRLCALVLSVSILHCPWWLWSRSHRKQAIGLGAVTQLSPAFLQPGPHIEPRRQGLLSRLASTPWLGLV